MKKIAFTMGIAMIAGLAHAQSANFDAETEGFQGTSFTTNGLTFFDVNNVTGINPDGSPFGPGDYGDQVTVERAVFLANDFPEVTSPNVLGVGGSFIPGDNLTINLFSSLRITNGSTATGATLDLFHFENGPWGGIEIRLDALRNGQVVATDLHVISDLGGRDNVVRTPLVISGVEFDELFVHATFDDGTTTVFSGVVDNVVFETGPLCPECIADWDNSTTAPDSSDFLAYLNSYASQDPCADLAPAGGDGSFDSSDFLAFLNAYVEGCR
ncbi:MAG: GC-type dockerin domain-anchored protein [Phycisphaerales bacterium]|jgi:hypothetical protein|nr:GC-type dockerin domain-anchored protein [Phycisphaerales bacterium]